MELTKEQQRRIQPLIDKCNKYDDESLDIYEVMNTYKCYLNASDEVRDYIYDVVVGALYGTRPSMIIGYARVSSKSQLEGYGLDAQIEEIKARYNDAKIYQEQYTGTKSDRPIFNEVLKELKEGDTLVVSKLDRLARNTVEGIQIVEELFKRGVAVHVLNVGLLENTSMGKFFLTTMLAVAEMERNTILERMNAGKEVAKARAIAEGRIFKEGRPKAHSKENIDRALKLLETMSYKEVVELTKISKSTLIRAKRERGLI